MAWQMDLGHILHVLTLLTPLRLISIQGANSQNVEGAGRYQNRFREHKKLFWGAPIK